MNKCSRFTLTLYDGEESEATSGLFRDPFDLWVLELFDFSLVNNGI